MAMHGDREERQGNRSKHGWLRRLFAGLLGAGLVAGQVPAGTAHAEGAAIPQHWISYAQLVSGQFQVWLVDADDAAALRIHEYLQARTMESTGVEAPGAFIVRVWVGQDGTVSNLVFDSLGQPAVDADLRSVLGRRLLPAPPQDMRQPMVLRLKLDFAV